MPWNACTNRGNNMTEYTGKRHSDNLNFSKDIILGISKNY